MKRSILFGLLFLSIVIAVAGSQRGMDTSNMYQAQLLINTMFSERTPGFDDLYMIQTPDKGREIVIYCNPVFCYKLKGHMIVA